MADSAVFDHVCAALEQRTSLDRLEARGTVRIALREAGLDAAGIDVAQMKVVLHRLLPNELTERGIAGASAILRDIESSLDQRAFEIAPDRASAAAATIGRLGG